jgi:hypothetical protein
MLKATARLLPLVLLVGGLAAPAQAAGQRVSPNLIVLSWPNKAEQGPAPVILRGERAERRLADAADAAAPIEAAAGDVLWFVDPGEDQLVACEPRDTSRVGERRIRCVKRALPVPLAD